LRAGGSCKKCAAQNEREAEEKFGFHGWFNFVFSDAFQLRRLQSK
jgi:hypothetical protein